MDLVDKLRKTASTVALVSAIFIPNYQAKSAEQFIRGDSTQDERIDLSDPVLTLDYLFRNGEIPSCLDAADVNDDGEIDISDPVYTLNFLFGRGRLPREPYPSMGYDATPDRLTCEGQTDLGMILVNQKDIPLSIRDSGTVDNPLVYIIGEDLLAEGTGITVEGSNIKIEGEDRTLSYAAKENDSYGIHILNSDNVRINNLNIEENSRSTEIARNYGLLIVKSNNIDLANLDVTTKSTSSPAVNYLDSTNQEIIRLEIKTSGRSSPGVSLNNSNDLNADSINIETEGEFSPAVLLEDTMNSNFTNSNIESLADNSPSIYFSRSSDANNFRDSSLCSLLHDVEFSSDSNGNLDFTNVSFFLERVEEVKEISYNDRIDFNEGSTAKLNVRWHFDVRVLDHDRNPIENAGVILYNNVGKKPEFQEYTDSQGRIERQSYLEFTRDRERHLVFYPYYLTVAAFNYHDEHEILHPSWSGENRLLENFSRDIVLERLIEQCEE